MCLRIMNLLKQVHLWQQCAGASTHKGQECVYMKSVMNMKGESAVDHGILVSLRNTQ